MAKKRFQAKLYDMRITRETKEHLQAIADANELSLAQVVRCALREWLAGETPAGGARFPLPKPAEAN